MLYEYLIMIIVTIIPKSDIYKVDLYYLGNALSFEKTKKRRH